MYTFSYIEINLIALAIIVVIFLNIKNKRERYFYDQKLFTLILAFNVVILLFDTATWLLNMQPGQTAMTLNKISNTIYYMLNPVPCMLWAVYADFQISKDEPRIKKLSLPLSVPVVINAVMALLSPAFGLLFSIDENNVYHRGNLFLVMCVISLSYFLYTFFKLVRNKNLIDRKQYFSLLSFPILPVISAILQIIFYGISVIWISMAFALLIVFINIQNNMLYTDHLTGVYNRRQLDNYLSQRIKNRMRARYLAGVMIDVNSFKKINDLFGHTAGDNALIVVADILKKCFRKSDFIARYGGDEFVVVMEIREKGDLHTMINRLKQTLEAFNNKKSIPYEISLSIGYDIYKSKTGISVQKFYKHIDKLMYEDKKSKAVIKQGKVRGTKSPYDVYVDN